MIQVSRLDQLKSFGFDQRAKRLLRVPDHMMIEFVMAGPKRIECGDRGNQITARLKQMLRVSNRSRRIGHMLENVKHQNRFVFLRWLETLIEKLAMDLISPTTIRRHRVCIRFHAGDGPESLKFVKEKTVPTANIQNGFAFFM